MIGTLIGPAAAALAAVTVGGFARTLIARPDRASFGAPPGRSSPTLGWSVACRVFAFIGVVAAISTMGPLRGERRRRAAIDRALPDAMDQLVLSVRAGLTPFQAVCDLARSAEGATGDAFGEVVRRTERGQPFADALAALPQRLGHQAGALADVIATSDRHGLPLGPMLDQLTLETRATRRRLDQAEARKLPVRLSFPLVVCTLPSFVLLAIAPAVIAALSSLGATAW